MNKATRAVSLLGGIALLAALTLSGCSSLVANEIELPTISLDQTETPTASPSASASQNPSASPSATPSESPSESPSSRPERVSDAYAELDMEDQSGDGLSVKIDEVRMSLGSGLLVIFDGQGKVLGLSKVTVNTQPVALSLRSPILQSQKLYAQLFVDDGDGEFDPNLDTPILDDDGDLARESFDYKVLQG